MTPSEQLVCAIIRGDITSWTFSDHASLERLIEAAFEHNVHIILSDTLKKSSTWSHWPLRLREVLEAACAAASALDLIREQELRRVLNYFDSHGIRPILLKGVPLAYNVYRSPALRPRGDTDFLIQESQLETVTHILKELDYDGPDIQTDKLTSYQCAYRRTMPFGSDHKLDVHWKINNSQLFADTLTFAEVSADAIPIPSLARCARGLGRTHSLLLACMHRFGHVHAPFYVDGNPVYAGNHLRWVYDIHLLCSALNLTQWSVFTTLAETKRMAAFCVDGLKAARQAFNTQIPAETMDALQTTACIEGVNVQQLRVSGTAWFLANLRALPNLRQRLNLIRQVALPPAAYIMEKYQTNSRLALPFLYGYRSVSGIFKRMRWSNARQ